MLTCLHASAAWGQSGVPRSALNAAGFPSRDARIELVGRLRYDSNVLRGFQGPTGAGGRREDVIASPSVNVSLTQPISRQDIFLSGSVGYDFYRYNKRLERERINLTGGAHLRAGQTCTATPSINYQRALSDLGDLVGATGLPARVNVQETVDYGLEARCGGATGLTAGGGYHHSRVSNSAPLRQQLNVDTNTYNGQIGLAGRSIGTISIYGTYVDGTYPNRVAGGAVDPGDGIRSYSAGARYERRLGTYFYSTVSVGWTRVSPRSAMVDDFNGVSFNGDIEYTREPIRLKIGFSRSAEQSNLIQSAYAINTQFSGTGEYAFNDRLSVVGAANFGRRRFVQSPTVILPLLNPRLRDTTYYGSLGLRYSLTRTISLSLEGAYEERQAVPDIFSYSSTQASLSLRWNI